MTSTPEHQANGTISVVVSALDAGSSITPCLESVLNGSYRGNFEVIVVDGSADETSTIVAQRFPGVRLLRSPERLFPGDARNLGIGESSGDILAFLDGDCVPDREWLSQISRVHEASHPAVGGVIENGNPSRTGWVSYFCKLAKWMPRPAPEQVGDLPSESLSVKRWALTSYGPFLEGTYSSATAFSWRLNEEGHAPWLDPSIKVARVGGPSLRTFLRNEPRHGMYYARVRAKEQGFSTARRLIHAAGSPILPFLLFARAASAVRRHKRYMREFVASAPLVLLGFTAWSFGEFLGYLSAGAD
jgi:glycosyltransferase involved in cell wall biosynthesis